MYYRIILQPVVVVSFQQTLEFELSADFNINYTISNLKIKTYDIRTMQRKESNQRP